MKFKVLLIVFFLAVSLVVICYDYFYRPPAGQQAPARQDQTLLVPDFNFKSVEGNSYRFADFQGGKVLLNFWATWCVPCIEEFPLLIEIARQRRDLTLIAISVDSPETDLAQFFSRLGIQMDELITAEKVVIGLDPERKVAQGLFQVYKYPESFLIGTTGEIEKKFTGVIKREDFP